MTDNPANPLPRSGIITDVQTQRKRQKRRSIFIDGEFALGISEEMYAKYALVKGRHVTQEFLEEVVREEGYYQARQVALRFTNSRLRSRREIVDKLNEREFPREVIESTLGFLSEYGIVDDRNFARSFVNDQLLRRPMGRRRLQMELANKGIARDVIEDVLTNVFDANAEFETALTAAHKKSPLIRHNDPQKWERSMTNFLAGRGFGWDVITTVLKQLRSERSA